jgi:hypothetical protein
LSCARYRRQTAIHLWSVSANVEISDKPKFVGLGTVDAPLKQMIAHGFARALLGGVGMAGSWHAPGCEGAARKL